MTFEALNRRHGVVVMHKLCVIQGTLSMLNFKAAITLNDLLLFSFLTIFTSCKGQQKTSTPEGPITSTPIPTVIRNFKAVGVAPDFDTTLVSQYIRSIFQDSKGDLWFGTLGEGVVRYDGKTMTNSTEKEGLEHNYAGGIAQDKAGNMWWGAGSGLFRFHGNRFY